MFKNLKYSNQTIKRWTVLIAVLFSFSNHSSEDDLYDFLWLDPDKKVYVLQNKTYKKENNFFINLGYIKNNSSDFQSTSGVHFSGGYYFHEEWALEMVYHQYNNSENDALQNIKKVNSTTPFIIKPKQSYAAMLVWSPFYGKINTFNKIIYLDWSFGLGAGQITTESNSETVANTSTADTFQERTDLNIKAKTALRIHVTPSFHVGIEYHRDNFKAPGPKQNGTATTKWRNVSDTILSIGFSF